MADKRTNRLLLAVVTGVIVLAIMVTCSSRTPTHTALKQLPAYQKQTARYDGDSTTDTIKALQAYAKQAVTESERLHSVTEARLTHILSNTQHLARLEHHSKEAADEQILLRQKVEMMTVQVSDLVKALAVVSKNQYDAERSEVNADLPVGFGFDDMGHIQQQGQWYDSVGKLESPQDNVDSVLTPLLSSRHRAPTMQAGTYQERDNLADAQAIPMYTLPKDTALTDSIALTALIGRIPVKGQTPDPYPIKIFIGEDNIAANGHSIPEVEGMIFSGLGVGDWNLSCVSARLFSATFIFKDGSVINHSSDDPLGYLSDPNGVPCVAGRFVSNANSFLTQRIGLASVSAAGQAYAEAQQQHQISALTGSTTKQLIGDLNKVATGQAVQSASDEISRWLLDRQQQSFDAVVVDPGANVVVHLNRSLAIDYQPQARRIRYEQASDALNFDLD